MRYIKFIDKTMSPVKILTSKDVHAINRNKWYEDICLYGYWKTAKSLIFKVPKEYGKDIYICISLNYFKRIVNALVERGVKD